MIVCFQLPQAPKMKKIRLIEVSPRDGLQNEATPVSTQSKYDFVLDLLAAGCQEIELTSFVRADKIPQLSDAVDLTNMLKKATSLDKFWVLVLNKKGLETAVNLGFKKIALLTTASETFAQKNMNCSVVESLNRVNELAAIIHTHNLSCRLYTSMTFGCPYEGDAVIPKFAQLFDHLNVAHIDQCALGDTIGVSTPCKISQQVNVALKHFSVDQIGLHLHDTMGFSLANVSQGLRMGITTFDASVAGLGGCPYAKGASGNLASEDLVAFLRREYSASVEVTSELPDLQKLFLAGKKLTEIIGKKSASKMHQYLININS